jgi:SOS-response transcriptional repressor LexA
MNDPSKFSPKEEQTRPLSKVLNQLMQECDIDGLQLAKNVGVTPTTIYRLLNDPSCNPTLASLDAIAKYFSITISQLIGDDSLPNDRIRGTHQPDINKWNTIPHLTWEEAAHWPERKLELESTVDRWTATDATVSNEAFALTMEGDSMYPRFPEGTLLIIDPKESIYHRAFVVLLSGKQSKPLFKQILINGSEYFIKSLHKDFKEIKKISLNSHKIIGVMVQARTEFKK